MYKELDGNQGKGTKRFERPSKPFERDELDKEESLGARDPNTNETEKIRPQRAETANEEQKPNRCRETGECHEGETLTKRQGGFH